MTRLVLHAGAEFTDGGAVQRDLVVWRDPLAEGGVVLPDGTGQIEWREIALGLVGGLVTTSATELLTSAKDSNAQMLLVSSDGLSDALTSPDEAAALAKMALSAGVDVTVVVVVREQIGYINSLYCHRVLGLDTARSFADFATNSVPAHRFDYVASFGAIADAEGVDLVAIPYPVLKSKGAGRAVLEAVGLSSDILANLPGKGVKPAALPGPVLIGATRLLHKRLRRHGLFTEHGRAPLRALVEQLTARATKAGWDRTPFWGWEPELRRVVEEEYGASNEMFAEFVWGTPWEESWSNGVTQRVDLAELEPALLHDVMTTVDRLVRDLVRR